ncbi:hypothetical protein VDQ16_11910 [Xanthomonas campestris pv. campestris]|nr:hypothetical protein [Xanthomonas campestris]MEA0763491.1 hypothetical protein [Xanthomonas campestris pv. campestris]MEA9738453.1 hypothetical protein [Xanthomonas campestris pv. raphani]MEB1225187.1 hypothetical protein [Xanthomonas campestris pv. campestris]MEB1245881.1 hypothetical protein [Xanthomonas campestris pv. campestris]MEB1254167.1 hypothetical protein [Xanthomonas campestris pv. campestris]
MKLLDGGVVRGRRLAWPAISALKERLRGFHRERITRDLDALKGR